VQNAGGKLEGDCHYEAQANFLALGGLVVLLAAGVFLVLALAAAIAICQLGIK
jgi:hypothetical protein